MRLSVVIALLWVFIFAAVSNAGNGIDIDFTEGVYAYKDDFQTSRFMEDGFPVRMGIEQWRPGAIFNKGPDSGRALVYRFYSEKQITAFDISIDQRSNMPNLGGSISLYVSSNGIDWLQASSSSTQQPDANGWQQLPLSCDKKIANQVVGGNEIWFKLVMDNSSGLPTGESSTASNLDIKIWKSSAKYIKSDPDSINRDAFFKFSKATRTVFDVAKRDICYLEDVDGEIVGINEKQMMWESQSIFTAKQYRQGKRIPLASVLYIKTNNTNKPLYAAISLICSADASRRVSVSWNGKLIRTVDSGSFIKQTKTFHIMLARSASARVNILRIGGQDSGAVRLTKCEFAGNRNIKIVKRPALPKAGKLTLVDAYYMPDPMPPINSQAVEGRQQAEGSQLVFAGLQRMYKEHEDFGAIRVIVRNDSKQAVHVGDNIRLNGQPVESSYVDFVKSEWDARGVVWYRMRPNALKPSECGQLYIRFRRRPEGESAAVSINPINSPGLKINIPYVQKPVSLDYATADKTMQNLYIYIRRQTDSHSKITDIRLNVLQIKPLQIESIEQFGDITAVKITLSKPLKTGDYCVAEIGMADGNKIAAQFRILPFWFPKTSYHIPPEVCNSVGMNFTMWTPKSLDDCLKYDIYTNTMDVFEGHDRTRLVLGPDEPDAYDNAGGGYDRGLGKNARQIAESGWQELIQRFMPQASSWLMMNGTTRPLNWAVYSQLADICAFDPYPVTFYGADHAYVGESLDLARSYGAPNRMYACLEAYGWQTGQGVPTGARGPSTSEYRQNVVQAIGAGAKGLTSWVYVAMAGGWQNRPDFASEILKCNKMIQNIEDLLIIGTPVRDIAYSNAGKVMTGTINNEHWEKDKVKVSSLMCGTDALVITAVNHIQASKSEPAIVPAMNTKVNAKLPIEFKNIEVYEASEYGLFPVNAEITENGVIITIDKLESGRIFVIRKAK